MSPTVQLALRISEDLKRRATEAAKKKGITFSEFVREAIVASLEKGQDNLQAQIDELRRRVEALENKK